MIHSVVFRLTDYCNLACAYCYAERTQKGRMDFSIAKEAIDRFLTHGPFSIQFTGGEPLLEIDRMMEIISYIEKNNKRASYSVQTNATLIDRQMARRLREHNIAVGVSLDGIGEANSLRVFPSGESSYSKVIDGIKALRDEGVCCNVNLVLTRANQSHLSEFVDVLAYLGNVKGIGFDVLRPIGRAKGTDLEVEKEHLQRDLDRFLHEVQSLEKLGVKIHVREMEKIRRKIKGNFFPMHYCNATTGESITVDFKGDLYPCSSLIQDEHLLGNVFSGIHSSFSAMPEGKCRECDVFKLCLGGCPASKEESDCLLHQYWIKRSIE